MIELKNVSKSFGTKHVLRGLNLQIAGGETTTIIGGSGSGKSVLFKHIIGLLKPDSGEIWVDGRDITRMKDSELFRMVGKFGMVFQSGALFDSMTVRENVAFGVLGHADAPSGRIDEIVAESLAMVGLPDIARLMPSELSGGMKKRVAIARVVAKQPQIIMYDEPTTGLDPIMADVINNLIIKVGADQAITSIAITHDMVSAYKISDKIAVLFEGSIIETGTPNEIRNSAHPVVRQFIEGKAEGPIRTGDI
jgi:phospholipid/cholesterol/gamma-HCH transport system ATP-binding protein